MKFIEALDPSANDRRTLLSADLLETILPKDGMCWVTIRSRAGQYKVMMGEKEILKALEQ